MKSEDGSVVLLLVLPFACRVAMFNIMCVFISFRCGAFCS